MQLITQSYFEQGGPSASPQSSDVHVLSGGGGCCREVAVHRDPSARILSHKSRPCPSHRQVNRIQDGEDGESGHRIPWDEKIPASGLAVLQPFP